MKQDKHTPEILEILGRLENEVNRALLHKETGKDSATYMIGLSDMAKKQAQAPDPLAERDRLLEINKELLAACKKLMRLQHAQFVGSSEGNQINRDSIVAFAQRTIAKAEKS